MTIVLRQGELNRFKSDARYVKYGLKELVQIEGRTYRVLTYVRCLTFCERFVRGLAWALSYITIIPLLFCRTSVSRLFKETRTKTVTKTVFTPIDYKAKFEKLKKHIVKIIAKPVFINALIFQDFSLENYSKLKKWLKARDKLVVWAAIAREAKIAENHLNILEFPNIEATVEKAEKFGDWCVQNADEVDEINSLDLKYNRLSNLPGEIGNLSQLSYLNLSNNRLSNLPGEIGNLSRLMYLYLRGNPLRKLPKEISNLSQLRRLNLGRSQLSKLPEKIGKLSQLRKLSLNDNLFKKFPLEIGSLSLLKELSLDNNQLTKLPKKIGNFSQLKYLFLDDNQLTKLPTEIGNLSKLRYLFLRDNPLKELPEEIENLELLGCRIVR